MANYFSERNELENKIRDLAIALNNLRDAKDDACQNYLAELANLIKSRPGLTATQYAMLMSDNAYERNSIQKSISNMGYMAEAYEKNWHTRPHCVGDVSYVICANPSMPSLKREQTTVKRRFIEVDENNQPIGTHEYEEVKYTYSMEG